MKKFVLSLVLCLVTLSGFTQSHHISLGYSNPVSLIVTHKNPQDDKTNLLGALSAGVQVNYAYFAPKKPFSFHGNLDVFFPYLQFSDSERRLTNSTVGIEVTAGGAYVWKKNRRNIFPGRCGERKIDGNKTVFHWNWSHI